MPASCLVAALAGIMCLILSGLGATPAGASGDSVNVWNGTSWLVVPHSHGHATANSDNVTCETNRLCFAVGNYADGGTQQPCIWNGRVANSS
jgi:hypothetical protein